MSSVTSPMRLSRSAWAKGFLMRADRASSPIRRRSKDHDSDNNNDDHDDTHEKKEKQSHASTTQHANTKSRHNSWSWLLSSISLVFLLLLDAGVIAAFVVAPKYHMLIYNAVGVVYGLLRVAVGLRHDSHHWLLDNTVYYIMYFRYLSQMPMIVYKLKSSQSSSTPYLYWADALVHVGSSVLWFSRYVVVPYAKRRRWGKNAIRLAETGVYNVFCEVWALKCAIYVAYAALNFKGKLVVEATAELLSTGDVLLGLVGMTTKSYAKLGVLTTVYSTLKLHRYFDHH